MEGIAMEAKEPMSEEQRQQMILREESYRFTLETDKRHEQLFAPFGVTFPMYRTLAYLLCHPEGAAPSQIADDLLILRQSMTNILDTLEKRKLVERIADPTDRRRLIVKLLPEGETLSVEMVNEEDAYSQRIRAYMGQEDMDEFHRLERKIYESKVAALNDVLSEREK